jgi:carboxyl-terminal processing protease
MKKSSLLFLAVLVCTPAANAQEDTASSRVQLTIDDLRTFTDVFNQLRTHYVEEVDDHALLMAAIEGMVTRLDPYSAFLDSDQSRALEDSARGRYGGIGIRIDLREGKILVDEIIADSPAERAGVKAGDLVTAVDGQSVRDRKLFESVDALLGEPGTGVTIRFKTGNQPSREMQLVREFIPVSSVRSQLLEDNYGYFEINHFHRNSHVDLENEILAMQAGQDTPLSGIILDLRGNPGGVLRPAVEMADGFLDGGMIVYTTGRYEATRLEFRALPGQWAADVPLVLLVNSRTASASEVLAAALKDHGRAVIIGERTYGKGSIQSIFNLRNGSTLKLTTAHYFSPSGNTIHNNGIQPDVLIKSPHENLALVADMSQDPLVLEALLQLKSKTGERLNSD